MDNFPTALFDSYEQDFRQIIDSIHSELDRDGNEERSEERKAALRRVIMDLDEADELISQMMIEIQAIPQSMKMQYQSRLKTAQGDLDRYKKLSKDLQSQATRAELLGRGRVGTPTSDEPYGNISDRSRLLTGTATLEDGTRRLQDSRRIALEAEDQGAEILMNLRTQREQIENARDTLRTADTAIDRASGTLKKMISRMYQQRVVTAAIIVVLVLLIAVILWEKLLR